MSGILVTFGSILQAQSDVNDTVARTESSLADLKSYLAPMVAGWEGGAFDSYQALQQQWDRAADDLKTTLQQISAHLGRSHESYTSTEHANTQLWGS